jgi:hypothetical protein
MASRIPFRSTFLGLAALAASGFVLPSSALAQNIWYVSLNGGGTGTSWASTTTLDNALAISSAGDFIRVRQEATPYYPTVATSPLDARTRTFNITKSLNIRGGYLGNEPGARPNGSSESTILHGDLGVPFDISDNAYHVVSVTTKNPVVIQGFRIQSGSAIPASSSGPLDTRTKGGGIYTVSGADVKIGFVHLTDNGADDRGAAIYLNSATAVLRQVSISLNSGSRGAGISAEKTQLDVVNGRFYLNGFCELGGALHLLGGKSILTNCVFDSNFVDWPFTATGGAVYLANANHSVFTNCTFVNNEVQVLSLTTPQAHVIDNLNNPTGSCALANTIVWQPNGWNTAIPFFQGDALAGNLAFTAQFCDIQLLPATSIYPDSINPANTNINVNPVFSNVTPLAHSLHLDPNPLLSSPLFAAGNVALLPTDLTDIDNDTNFAETLPLDRERAARTVTSPVPPFTTFVAMGAIQAPDITFVTP